MSKHTGKYFLSMINFLTTHKCLRFGVSVSLRHQVANEGVEPLMNYLQ